MADEKTNKVLIAVDGSECSNYAVKWYLKELHRKDHEVIFAHVTAVPVPAFAGFGGAGMGMSPIMDDYNEGINHELKRFRERILDMIKGEEGKFRYRHEQGEAGSELCRIAKEERVSLIVTGTRGLGTIRRTILGSISDYVLHHAHCPVTIVRKDEHKP